MMVSTHGLLLVLGVDPFAGVLCPGFTHGDCLWDLSMGYHTGVGKFDGEAFWVGCGWFFVGGVGEGKRRLQGTFSMVCFFHWTMQVSEHPFLCYTLYIERWRFRCSIFRPSRRGPRSVTPWADTCALFKFRQPDDLLHTLKTVKGLLHLVPSRTSRSSGYGV